jgi:hypothetical protein
MASSVVVQSALAARAVGSPCGARSGPPPRAAAGSAWSRKQRASQSPGCFGNVKVGTGTVVRCAAEPPSSGRTLRIHDDDKNDHRPVTWPLAAFSATALMISVRGAPTS